MEMRCYHKILDISYRDHVTSKEVCSKIQQEIGPHKDLLTIIKKPKLQWYGHVSCSSDLAKTILQGLAKTILATVVIFRGREEEREVEEES